MGDRTLGNYRNDLLLRSATERQLFIVGEAMLQLVRWDETVASQIDGHRAVIGCEIDWPTGTRIVRTVTMSASLPSVPKI